jgi:hypothetical protein
MSEGRIQAGFYPGRAIAGSEQYAINEKNGNESIAIDVDVPSLERSFTTFLHFTDAAAPYSIERLRACGWTGDDLAKLDGIDRNEVSVQIKYETFDGKERMKVDISTGGGRVKLENTMNEKQKRAFAARLRPLLQRGAKPAAAHAAAPKANRREGAYDPGPPDESKGRGAEDDIPFISLIEPSTHERRLSRWERW